jgi:ABC-2 type transport system ATP-binding protein
MLFQGSLQELHQLQQKGSRLIIKTSDNEAAIELLQEYFPEREGDTISIPYQDQKQVASIQKMLILNNLEVYLLQPKENDLEQLFIDLISTHS